MWYAPQETRLPDDIKMRFGHLFSENPSLCKESGRRSRGFVIERLGLSDCAYSLPSQSRRDGVHRVATRQGTNNARGQVLALQQTSYQKLLEIRY